MELYAIGYSYCTGDNTILGSTYAYANNREEAENLVLKKLKEYVPGGLEFRLVGNRIPEDIIEKAYKDIK